MGLVKKGVYYAILLGAIITRALQVTCIITTYGTFDLYTHCPHLQALLFHLSSSVLPAIDASPSLVLNWNRTSDLESLVH